MGGTGVLTQEVTLNSGLAVRAPSGFCIDTRRTRQSARGASVLMASCANLGGQPETGALNKALVLVTAVPGTHGDLVALQREIQRAPQRLGRGPEVNLHGSETSRVALYVNLTDANPGRPPATDPRHWKAAVDVRGAAVIVSVFGAVGGPLTGRAGEQLIRDTVQALLDANSGQEPERPAAVAVATTPASSENTPSRIGERLRGIFRAGDTSS
ncbi:hypothetical protein [Shimia ponticola]|uniref:hypothetical protein n=1 Tax=Shimia ponticola TaxID=2582893 RepID=UPI00164AC6FF|nr:hypothetical protein [Shimia ponticola]